MAERGGIACHDIIGLQRRALIIVLHGLYETFRAFDVVHRKLVFVPAFSDEFEISVDLPYVVLPGLSEHLFIEPAVILLYVIERLFQIYVYIRSELEFLFRVCVLYGIARISDQKIDELVRCGALCPRSHYVRIVIIVSADLTED